MIVDQRILQKYPCPTASQAVAAQRIVHRIDYHDFFGLFPSYVRDDLLRRASYRDCRAGQSVFLHGDADTYMGVVLSGRLRMGMTMDGGRGVLLGLVEEGEIFGEMSLLDGLPRTIDSFAEDDSHLMLFRREDVLPTLMAYPEAMFGLIRTLCFRLRLYIDTIDMVASHNLPMRLAHYLLRLAGEYGEEMDGRIVIRAHLNQTAIGLQMATTRECINKNLKILVMRNLIEVDGEEITILDPAGLRMLAG